MERSRKHTGDWFGTAAEPGAARGDDTGSAVWRRPLIGIALLVVTVVALRGYLPDQTAEPAAAPREPNSDSMASLVIVAVLLVVSLTVIAVAVLSQLRNRAPAAPGAIERDIWRRGGGKRPTWRAVLLLSGLLIAYLLLVAILARMFAPLGINEAEDAGTATAPGAEPADTMPPGTQPPTAVVTAMPYLLAATVVFLAMIVVGSIAARRHSRLGSTLPAAAVGEEPAVPAPGGPDPLTRAAEVGLAEIEDLSREPRDAIIACYAAMERELARVPEAAPQQFDTASEVLARAVEHQALPAGSATRLVELFGEARFSRHVMREEHRDAAVRALQVVLGQLRSTT